MEHCCDIAIKSCSHFHQLPAVAELAQVRQRLLRRPHHVLPLAELVGERDEQLAVALALERGECEDARQVVLLGRGLEKPAGRQDRQQGKGGRRQRRSAANRGVSGQTL